jgi:ubiquinone/menaquinone biosynthesis C-methylase UbiE
VEEPVIVDERKRTVQAAYDTLGARFGAWAEQIEGDPWERYLDELAARLPTGGRVLDLGCGDGARIARLAETFELVAVDISEEQLRLARARMPRATLVHDDFGALDFDAEAFDAVTALYSFVHIPRDDQRALLERIGGWLKPGGLFLASLSHLGGEDRTYEWLGVEMFFSGFDAETNRRLVRKAGFELVLDEVVWMRESTGDVAFLWLLARRPR